MSETNKGISAEIVILGGGLAGLSAGYELARAGKKVFVIEKEDDVGGLARTIRVGDYSFDTGPHRWYTKNNMVNNWMLNIIGKETIKVPRLTRIYFDKKFFNYPIRLGNAMKGMGLYKSFRSVIDYFKARLEYHMTKNEPKTLEDGYISQFGRTLYETFFKRYSEKLWGRKCTEISADWIGQRSRGFNISTIIKDAIFKNQKTVSFIDEFTYPINGIGGLAHRLAHGIQKSQGKIFLNSEIIQIEHAQNAITSITVNSEEGKIKVSGKEYINSIAISDLVNILNPVVSKDLILINRKLKYRDEVQVVLFIKKTKITDDTWIYVHPYEIPFVRMMEMDNWSSILSPKGTTSIVFEIACNRDDTVWKKDDTKLINWVKESYIKEFKLIKRNDVLGGHVHRIMKEYPVYHLGYQKDVSILKKYLKRFTNLQLIGRNGMFRYNNMDHSIESGLYSAWNIITGERKFDIESVNIEKEYLEEKKIENPEDINVEIKNG